MRLGRIMRRLRVAVIGLCVGVLLTEILLRVTGISYPQFYAWDHNTGVWHRPNARGWWRVEGNAYVRINRDGLRDRDHTRDKPPEVLRIAVLGDSYAEAFQVPRASTFWSVLEGELSGCPAVGTRRVEVLNFGVSGYGTAQALMALRHRVWRYRPDVVVLAFYTGNDVRNNLRQLEGDPLRPYFVYRNGELLLDASYRPPVRHRMRSVPQVLKEQLLVHVRLVQVMRHVRNTIRTRVEHIDERYASLDNMVYLEPETPEWREAWRVTEGLLVMMRDEVREQSAEFLTVTLSTPVQAHPDSKIPAAFLRKIGAQDLDFPDRRIKALGEREGFHVLNVAPHLSGYAQQNGAYVHGFPQNKLGEGHWNEVGHRVAGEAIARELCAELIPQAARRQEPLNVAGECGPRS